MSLMKKLTGLERARPITWIKKMLSEKPCRLRITQPKRLIKALPLQILHQVKSSSSLALSSEKTQIASQSTRLKCLIVSRTATQILMSKTIRIKIMIIKMALNKTEFMITLCRCNRKYQINLISSLARLILISPKQICQIQILSRMITPPTTLKSLLNKENGSQSRPLRNQRNHLLFRRCLL